MKLAIVGYGKMGKLIEQLAPEYGFTIHARLDVGDNPDLLIGSDVAIEFSTPHAALGNIEALAALGIPTVVGTTGWLEHMDHVRTAVGKGGAGLVWAGNFSIGANVFMRAVHEVTIVGKRAGLRRVGLGNPPQYKKRCALGNTAGAGE